MDENREKIRVLMVDDETDFLESTSKALRRRDFDVTTASDGDQALKVSAAQDFDVCLLDVRMPGIDGHKLYYALHAKHPDMQIVMLTGHGDIQKAFELGRNGLFTYLAKPVEIEELVKTIQGAHKEGISNRLFAPDESRNNAHDRPVRVLLVDDELDFLTSMSKALSRRKMEVFTASDGRAALAFLSRRRVDVAVLDVKMPGIDGMDLLEHVKRAHPLVEVVLLTGHGNVSLAVESMKKGAFDYLTKPQEMEEFVYTIRAAGKHKREREKERQEAEIKELLDNNPT